MRGRTVRLTNLDKELFPADPDAGRPAFTKRDLIRHYVASAPVLRPVPRATAAVTVLRFPNGVGRPGFWQKDLPGHTPDWVRPWTFHHRGEGPKRYPVVDQAATLAWLAQEAAIELHPWTSTAEHPDEPSYALIDIDPGARDDLGRDPRPRAAVPDRARPPLRARPTEGDGQARHPGLDPDRPGYTFADTSDWVERLSRAVGADGARSRLWEWAKASAGRQGASRLHPERVDQDARRAVRGSRRPGAPVSAPIAWDELDDPELRPDRWTIGTLPGAAGGGGGPVQPRAVTNAGAARALAGQQHAPDRRPWGPSSA